MAKKTRWLFDYEAKSLSLDVKPNEVNRKNARYQIEDDVWDKLKKERKKENVSVSNVTIPNDYNKEKPFILSAWGSDGQMMDIDKYCKHYNLPKENITSYKLVSHTGTPFYNIVFKENILDTTEDDLEDIRLILNKELKRTYKYVPVSSNRNCEYTLKWSDLHFGAHIQNLLLTPDYDSNILLNGLLRSVQETNELGFKKVHVHINGDLIESFSGLNHINSWMSMDKDLIGSKAVMLCCDLLEKAFKEIKNLGCIKVVGGNHDRLSKNNDEDVKGGAAELICWGLRLKGFDVEFHPYIITHLVEGINHINLHGHCGISKRKTEEIIWKYGIKGVFNFVFEGHLHSLSEMLSVSKRDKLSIIKDDNIDYRRMHLQSFFTGNYYSETLGYSANSGYLGVWDNGNKKPMIFNGCV